MNPKRKRRRHKRRRMTAKQAQYFAPRRHRRRRSAQNPPRRHRRYYGRSVTRHRYRRHNPPAFGSLGTNLGWAAVGFMATKVVGNTVTPMLGADMASQPLMRIGIKLGVAYGSAWLLERFMGRQVFTPAFVGGSMEAIQDAVKTYIAPSFPMLAAYDQPLGIYVERPSLPMRRPTMGLYMDAGHDLGES